jgi:phosphoglucosamine mutase
MSTPGVAYLTRTFRASAGIVITASHNPYQDNGIKFFSAEGDKLPDAVELAIEAELDKPLTTVDAASLGKAKRVEDAVGRYIEFCKSTIPAAMSLKGLKIVVDCANGATYNTAPYVFDELGARVVAMGVEPDGLNINRDVGSTKPDAICRRVVQEGADLGIAFDGDGDRVMMVNSRGELMDGDRLLYAIARSRLAEGTLSGAVVGTLMSNLGLEHALARRGIGFVRTKVGDRYIMEHLKQSGGVLGGEPSGHIICRDRTTTGDGIVAALQVLAALKGLDTDLDSIAAEAEHYPQVLINVRLPERREVVGLPAVMDAVVGAERELAGRGRVLLRPSGTEPLVRVMVEGADRAQVQSLAEGLAQVVREQIAG